jgi:very-short-patch-repair endonuclease
LAIELRSNQTTAEQMLWDKIRNRQLRGFRFLKQYILDRYIADFYCSKMKVAVEIDGRIHERDDIKEYDAIREDVIKAHGIRIIRFSNDEIMHDIESVLERLVEFLESTEST